MSQIQVTITVKITQNGGNAFEVTETVNDPQQGDNPRWFASSVKQCVHQADEAVHDAVAHRFGAVAANAD